MIYATNNNPKQKEIEQAVAYIRQHGKDEPVGIVELDGKNLYILFQNYSFEGEENCRFETHEKYLDVQYIIEGEEAIAVTSREGMTVTEPYNETKDVTFYANDKKGTNYVLKAGDFLVLYPEDVHKPKIALSGPVTVKKAVVKIKL